MINHNTLDENDETGLIWYFRHEATDTWIFGNVNLHCVNLSLFRTAKGCIGVTHADVRPGDQVAVLLGAPVPLILRAYPEGQILIGQRYVTFARLRSCSPPYMYPVRRLPLPMRCPKNTLSLKT